MKTIKLITIVAFAFGVNIPTHAQFNTIGTINNRHVKTANPQKPQEAMTDSMEVADTVSGSKSQYVERNSQVTDSLLRVQDSQPLVSFPLKKIQINSKFGMRMHPIYHKRIMHNGVDLHVRHEDVLSMLPGRVIKVGYDERSGKFVTVQSANYTVSYCHLSQQYVRQNDFVKAGDAIGLTGKTGAATGEHLHLTTKKDGKAFNPVILINVIRKIRSANLTL